MASRKGISVPILLVDGEQIEYLPESLDSKFGIGDRNTRSQVAGDGVFTTVVTVDGESKLSMVKFKLATTSEHISFLIGLEERLGDIPIQISDSATGRSDVFPDMTLKTDPNVPYGSNAEIEFEFDGAQAA